MQDADINDAKEITLISVNDIIYDFGVRMLSSYLKKHRYKVHLIFLTANSDQLSNDILSKVSAIASQSILAGISVLTHNFDKAVKVTNFMRESNPEIPIVWGGTHVSGFPDACLNHADIVCVGEGEEALLELAERISKNENISHIPNMFLKDCSGEVIKNSPRPLIQDLDSLPFADYSLDSDFVTSGNDLLRLDVTNIKKHSIFWGIPNVGYVYVTMSSRGCPFNCTFCCNNVIRGLYKNEHKYVRKRSINNVIAEIYLIHNKFSFFNSIMFEDDSFMVRPIEELNEFSEKYLLRVKLPFLIQLHPNEVSYQKLAVLKRTGLSMVHMGIQSGDEQIRLKFYNRNTPTSKILEADRILTELKILHKYDIIIDTPFPKDAEASLSLVRQLKPYFSLNLYSLKLYPGLVLRKRIQEAGYNKWIEANEMDRPYHDILSDDPYTFALKLYTACPPKPLIFALARLFSADAFLYAMQFNLLRPLASFMIFFLKLVLQAAYLPSKLYQELLPSHRN